MNVNGFATVAASREAVFAAICDPGALLEDIEKTFAAMPER